ncbi:leucyl aminopeptidase family protein [Kineococcus rhizosphaerae]|uniref:leucyl aminopeptidase family protein n=1 Tax=Kineococcus rhizosphaerae TaxID=559628 RepID=UPI000D074382|nr:leucyl aminopeptidase family protein [Kineococcus rhizosphaerae]
MSVPAVAAAPDLRRWTPPVVEVRRGGVVGADLAGLDVLAVPVAAGEGADAPLQPRPGAADAAVRYGIDLAAVCAAEDVTGAVATTTRLPVPAPEGSPHRLVVVGVGDSSVTALRRSGAALARATGSRDVATTLADGVGSAGTRAFVEGFVLASYSPPVSGRKAAAKDEADGGARRLVLFGDVDVADVRHAEVSAGATVLTRDLAATPSNLKDPRWMTEEVRALAAELRLKVEVRDEARLRREGFGGLLAVGAGSSSPPALVQVGWTPRATPGAPHVVLVGKGITYDTGGLGIKPRESMVAMKTDMAGSAAVLAVVAAAARLKLPVKVTGLLALAENAFGASSYRPGDVVTHYGGRTTEVNNTDAEGRLVLGDALAYADAVLAPDVLVDVATLTGAAALGLGKRHAPLYSPDPALVDELLAASAATGERLWHMPLVEDYAAAIDSDLADARQVTTTPGHGAGSIVAALFLRPFAGARRWAHLDIAGTGRADGPEHEVTRGPTGFGARLLLEWLETSVAAR